MGNPSYPTLTEGEWTLVVENVITGFIKRLKSKYKYWAIYVVTGDPAPANTEEIRDKSQVLFEIHDPEEITGKKGIDIYIWIEDSNPDIDDSPLNSIQVST